MEDYIRPHVFVALRVPSGLHKVLQLKPNQIISLGKYGSFPANDLLGRPFHLTYEIVSADGDEKKKRLRVVSAAELYEQDDVSEATLNDDQPANEEVRKGEFEVVDQDGKILMRTNRNILDNNSSQKLTMAEIEELKRAESASGRDIIARIMASHSELDKKTAFSLAKYTTRKANKYLQRFVPVPVDVPFLAKWWLYEKEAAKVMEIREELLSLIASWSNVHYSDPNTLAALTPTAPSGISSGRWLVVDETGGLLVAAVAEKLGVLHPQTEEEKSALREAAVSIPPREPKVESNGTSGPPSRPIPAAVLAQESHMSATDNSITLVHSNTQPNLSMLIYYNYDQVNSDASHPLHRHLKTLSWLQLLHPEEDPSYAEPETLPQEELDSWKSAKRGVYHRKRRRWERIKSVIDQTRDGGFDGLVVASAMEPTSVAHHLVPLLKGGAPMVIYSANVEPLAELVDFYSTNRRTAFLNSGIDPENLPHDDFPVNPTLLLSPTIHTARVRPWQVLPGRTHPLMTGIGGPEGYIFTATRVLPIEGEKVEARGSNKRRRTTKPDGQ